jgi:serine O-acetyltransferase
MKQTFKYIQSDYYRYTGKKLTPFKLCIKAIFGVNHCFRYSFWLRLSKQRGGVGLLARQLHKHYSIKYGIQIPASTKIGYGFYIGHAVGIVINGRTQIGNNVNIGQFLSIGSNKGTPAIIGDNVYIGPHVSIVEEVHVGSNSLIAAGAVVIRDIPDNKTVAGCPAKNIGENKHPEYIINRWSY